MLASCEGYTWVLKYGPNHVQRVEALLDGSSREQRAGKQNAPSSAWHACSA